MQPDLLIPRIPSESRYLSGLSEISLGRCAIAVPIFDGSILADQSRTFAFVAMRENKLYILEGTVPKGYPEPGLFQQSIGWLDRPPAF